MERSLNYSKRVLQQIKETLAYIDENLTSKGADDLLEDIEEKMKRAKSWGWKTSPTSLKQPSARLVRGY